MANFFSAIDSAKSSPTSPILSRLYAAYLQRADEIISFLIHYPETPLPAVSASPPKPIAKGLSSKSFAQMMIC